MIRKFLVLLFVTCATATNVTNVRASHPVCYQIKDLWWSGRLAQKTRADIVGLDAICSKWDNKPDLCNIRSLRAGDQSLTPAERNAPCTMVGAHNRRCMSNPCNHFNTGDCNVQSTQGQCIWITKEMVPIFNKFYAQRGADLLPGYGCYRNPCNMPGYGRAIDECPGRSLPGYYECTWCKGSGDPELVGLGMGCQHVEPLTKSTCAYVNSPGVRKASIIQRIVNQRCQCSVDMYMCESQFREARGVFKFRYGQ